MGIKTNATLLTCELWVFSEKPPHHMGIKTLSQRVHLLCSSLKNLPTTWGLRLEGIGWHAGAHC